MAGHIHLRQPFHGVAGGYVGPINRWSFSDAGNPVGVDILDTESRELTHVAFEKRVEFVTYSTEDITLHDRTIGLLAEILQGGRARDLAANLDVLAAAHALFHIASGARISWANGLLDEPGCRQTIAASLELLFAGIANRNGG